MTYSSTSLNPVVHNMHTIAHHAGSNIVYVMWCLQMKGSVEKGDKSCFITFFRKKKNIKIWNCIVCISVSLEQQEFLKQNYTQNIEGVQVLRTSYILRILWACPIFPPFWRSMLTLVSLLACTNSRYARGYIVEIGILSHSSNA